MMRPHSKIVLLCILGTVVFANSCSIVRHDQMAIATPSAQISGKLTVDADVENCEHSLHIPFLLYWSRKAPPHDLAIRVVDNDRNYAIVTIKSIRVDYSDGTSSDVGERPSVQFKESSTFDGNEAILEFEGILDRYEGGTVVIAGELTTADGMCSDFEVSHALQTDSDLPFGTYERHNYWM